MLIEKAAEDPREVVTLDIWDAAHRMRDSVMAHPVASQLLTGGMAEQSIFARDPKTGLPLKVRPDYMNSNMSIMVDLKSCNSADPWKWGRDAGQFGYHLQQPMYMHVPTLLPEPMKFEDFAFILCENTAPYLCECATIDPDVVAEGREKFFASLELLKDSLANDEWPGYGAVGEILTVDIPKWLRA